MTPRPIDAEAAERILRILCPGDVKPFRREQVEQELARFREEAEAWRYQDRVRDWMLACFGREIAADKTERAHRFLEEALELVQAIGATRDDAHALVDYVFDREIGDQHQEVGGVLVTLAALCGAVGVRMESAGEDELARVWGKVDVIREKQRQKPHGSPLPVSIPTLALEQARDHKLIDTIVRLRTERDVLQGRVRQVIAHNNELLERFRAPIDAEERLRQQLFEAEVAVRDLKEQRNEEILRADRWHGEADYLRSLVSLAVGMLESYDPARFAADARVADLRKAINEREGRS